MSDEYKKMLERFEQICQNAKKELCGKKEKEQEKRFIEKIDKGLTISEYDEIEYWLTNVEVLDNTDYILNNRKAKILVRYLKEKQEEIEQLKAREKEHQRLNGELREENEKLNSIINKTINSVQEHYDNSYSTDDINDIGSGTYDDLMKVLKGVDKE